MVLIGMPVKVRRVRKRGERKPTKIFYEDAVVVERHKDFVVVQFPKGYKECFRESELLFWEDFLNIYIGRI